jgi:hypothetical protein
LTAAHAAHELPRPAWCELLNIERLVGQPVMAMIPCINVVYVSPDTAKRDPYGTQIERASSVQHKTQTTAHGRYWC